MLSPVGGVKYDPAITPEGVIAPASVNEERGTDLRPIYSRRQKQCPTANCHKERFPRWRHRSPAVWFTLALNPFAAHMCVPSNATALGQLPPVKNWVGAVFAL